MSEDMVIAQCSPTMAGLKTGSLFACPVEDRAELAGSMRRLNATLVPRGLRMVPVKYTENKALMYMYRPDRLQQDLKDETAGRILAQKGYPLDNTSHCVAELARRLNYGSEFPHEIGLFLGYPSEDVYGFIKEGSGNAKYVGTWRVYGDEQTAIRRFRQFEKCTRVYSEVFRKNGSFKKLIVNAAN